MNETAIQNLDFLRQLIADIRASEEYKDAERLRMLQVGDIGLTGLTAGGEAGE